MSEVSAKNLIRGYCTLSKGFGKEEQALWMRSTLEWMYKLPDHVAIVLLSVWIPNLQKNLPRDVKQSLLEKLLSLTVFEHDFVVEAWCVAVLSLVRSMLPEEFLLLKGLLSFLASAGVCESKLITLFGDCMTVGLASGVDFAFFSSSLEGLVWGVFQCGSLNVVDYLVNDSCSFDYSVSDSRSFDYSVSDSRSFDYSVNDTCQFTHSTTNSIPTHSNTNSAPTHSNTNSTPTQYSPLHITLSVSSTLLLFHRHSLV